MTISAGLSPSARDQVCLSLGTHRQWLRRRCCRELAGFPQSQIEEIAQDVLLVAWRRLCRDGSSFPDVRPFLARIALFLCRNARRKHRDVLFYDGASFDPVCPEQPLVERLLQAEHRRRVAEVVRERLDPLDQEIVRLRFSADLSAVEIAERKGLPDPDMVRVAMQRIRRRLRPELQRRLGCGW